MSDTVGFIQKLPTELVAAFRCVQGKGKGGYNNFSTECAASCSIARPKCRLRCCIECLP